MTSARIADLEARRESIVSGLDDARRQKDNAEKRIDVLVDREIETDRLIEIARREA